MITTLSDQSDVTILAAIDAFTPEQVFKVTLVQCIDVFENDGGLFAEDYFEGNYDYDDGANEEWHEFANDFNERMLRALVDIPLEDADAREFLLTAFGAGARCTLRIGPFEDTFKSLVQQSAQAVCYHIAMAVARKHENAWGIMLDDARAQQTRHSAELRKTNEVGGSLH